MTVRPTIATFAAAAVLIGYGTAPAIAAQGDARYWTVADRLQRTLDPAWSGREGLYMTHGSESAINGQMLVTHALAALHDHEGPARQDARARAIAARLTASPPFLPRLPPKPWDAMTHVPGWSSGVDDLGAPQHPVFETQIVGGLVAAWRARRQLGLDRSLVRRIEHEIGATAAGSFYRWPAVRLNQFNWNTDFQAAAATVTGNPSALRSDLQPPDPAQRSAQPRLGRVREHRLDVRAALRGGESGRHAAATAGGVAAVPALGPPGHRRLLDARRLSQLGHGVRLQALAPGEEARPRAGCPDRARDRPRPRAVEPSPALDEVAPGPDVLAVPRLGRRVPGRAAAAAVLRRPQGAAAVLRRPPRRRPGASQRGPRRRRRARTTPLRTAACALRLRSRYGPPRGDNPDPQHGRHGR